KARVPVKPNPAITAGCGRAEVGRIGSRVRLGQREGRQLLALRKIDQPPPPLVLAAKQDDGLRPDGVVDVEDDRGAGTEASDLLDEDREGDVVETGRAIFFR